MAGSLLHIKLCRQSQHACVRIQLHVRTVVPKGNRTTVMDCAAAAVLVLSSRFENTNSMKTSVRKAHAMMHVSLTRSRRVARSNTLCCINRTPTCIASQPHGAQKQSCAFLLKFICDTQRYCKDLKHHEHNRFIYPADIDCLAFICLQMYLPHPTCYNR